MKHSKSALLLMELSIAILFFALCAGVCLQLFAKARTLSEGSVELAGAVAAVENSAERWLAGESGDTEAYYDSNWKKIAEDGRTAAYIVSVKVFDKEAYDGLINAEISARPVEKVKSDENENRGQIIYSLELVKRDGERRNR